MLKESCLSKINRNRNFQQLVRSLPPHDEIRDAEFYIRSDGILFNADGYAHPVGKMIGGALYAPNIQGNKQIFGIQYTKTTLYPGTYDPIPYAERSKHYRKIDPELDQVAINPFPFIYEQILPVDQFVGYIPAENAYNLATNGFLGDPQQIIADLGNLAQLLDVKLTDFSVGLTGALALGQVSDYHDLDIVFRGSLTQNRLLADKMRDLVIHEPERILDEGGKNWLIRFFNRNGKSNGMLMCCFFGYNKLQDAPLREFTARIIENDIEIQASVSDATHALYTPTIVTLYDAHTIRINGQNVCDRLSDNIPLVIYHTGTRGELNYSDQVWVHGALVEITTREFTYPAVMVIEREGVRNETPPWPNYYTRSPL